MNGSSDYFSRLRFVTGWLLEILAVKKSSLAHLFSVSLVEHGVDGVIGSVAVMDEVHGLQHNKQVL